MSVERNAPNNTYMVDPESPAEMTRLQNQDRLVTKYMGGLLEGLNLSHTHDVLDIACGPGAWALDVAFAHPHMEVVGFDISQRMIEYAQVQAEVQELKNVQFRVLNALHSLDFPDASFDLINGRYLSTFMLKEAWPALVAECKRLLRPGGMLRLTEFERALTNSPAHEQISTLFCQALHVLGRSFSPDGLHLGIMPVLGGFLQQAGFQSMQTRMYACDYSSGTEDHREWCNDLRTFFQLAQPFVVKTMPVTAAEWQRLYERVTIEMDMPEFRAIAQYLTVVGYR